MLGRHKFDNARRQDHAVVYCKLTMNHQRDYILL